VEWALLFLVAGLLYFWLREKPEDKARLENLRAQSVIVQKAKVPKGTFDMKVVESSWTNDSTSVETNKGVETNGVIEFRNVKTKLVFEKPNQ
jgi:hypothetical protein